MILYSFRHRRFKMLRALVTFSVFIPAVTNANEKEPYLYQLNNAHKENPVIDTEENKFIGRTPYEYTFTAKPANEPVQIKPITEKTLINIPAYIVKSLELNDTKYKKNTGNIKDLFSNVGSSHIIKIQLPVAEHGENQPIKQNIVSNVRPTQTYKKPLQMSKEKVWKNKDFLSNAPAKRFLPLSPTNAEKINEPVNKLTVLIDNAQYDPQLPVLTEKPLYEQNANRGRIGQLYMSHLPVLTKKPTSPIHKENLLKRKLLSLFLSSKKDVEKQIKNTQAFHDTFKSGTMYRIGYLTSLIYKINNRIKVLYETVEQNQQIWDSLRILEAYEQVISMYALSNAVDFHTFRQARAKLLRTKMKRDNEMIQELLNMVQSFLRIKGKSGSEVPYGNMSRNKPSLTKGISWSYYDDSMP